MFRLTPENNNISLRRYTAAACIPPTWRRLLLWAELRHCHPVYRLLTNLKAVSFCRWHTVACAVNSAADGWIYFDVLIGCNVSIVDNFR